jgi:hypothetical protein
MNEANIVKEWDRIWHQEPPQVTYASVKFVSLCLDCGSEWNHFHPPHMVPETLACLACNSLEMVIERTPT